MNIQHTHIWQQTRIKLQCYNNHRHDGVCITHTTPHHTLCTHPRIPLHYIRFLVMYNTIPYKATVHTAASSHSKDSRKPQTHPHTHIHTQFLEQTLLQVTNSHNCPCHLAGPLSVTWQHNGTRTAPITHQDCYGSTIWFEGGVKVNKP